jgi:7-cyano-7-deazaguanine synthase in queuosine biosynthesis
MKPTEHYRETAANGGGRVLGALAVLPDIGVVMQRLPSTRVKRWGAVLHHDLRTIHWLLDHAEHLGGAFASHYWQDESSHPPGTYRADEAAGLPPADKMVLLYSGGPDAFITWRLLGRPDAIYVGGGHLAEEAEVTRVQLVNRRFAPPGRRIKLLAGTGAPAVELPTGWIPYRNLRLILTAAQYHPDVVMARIAEWGPDKNPGFFRRTERLLASSRGGHFQAAAEVPKVRIHTPVGHLTKTQLVRRYLQEFGDDAAGDLVTFTWSCYGPGPKFCGQCGGCWCRWVAFTNNGIDESGRYEQLPTRHEYYRRLHWADFRPSMVPMYVKRAREMKGMG